MDASKTNPTPGPWVAEGPTGKNMREGYSQPWAVRTEPWDRCQIVCGCFGDIGGDEVAKANAHLMAAAPDLLAALETCAALVRERAEYTGETFSKEALAKALTALAKARGE